ncbi:DHA2 family efflux MFS transporter permease subunit [Pseudofrankia inefficax]|uniref:Drug resistance transporter, EmrB/QacA subfamily n=1 Tax=Pseudofrankia inefficax (strain DSM 45817 / CECT 9037 / DDB 130130 / EuI1c) TaxID=298654 RepID=E3J7J8_PSEI1|nr:DHA2 family efflux MFS transporter permease subunit [Pseudofrankia inefficax]ADP79607.1 drug resistance transporter, EmrB/QacA subfamily [Pseudofrankia inefficax]
MTTDRSRLTWTIIITCIAAFMTSLDNLVVTMALPSIREHLHASLAGLEWTVNAYTLSFAVLLLPAAALGDRLGRRRVFAAGLAIFTVASAAAALAPDVGFLIAARAVQGVGGAIVLPLSMTLLSAAVPAERRGAALGIWGGVSGLAIALGPLVGGAITQGAAWQWIFWLNVPLGLAAIPLAFARLTESREASSRLDTPGTVLVSLGLFGVVLGLVRGQDHGWTSAGVLGAIAAGAVGLAAFVAWEIRSERSGGRPMLPVSLFRRRGFAAVNAVSVFFSFGMFGSIFLLSQYLQNVMGYSPLGAGLRTLPWTVMPLLVAPIAGPLSDRIGGRPLMITGLTLMTGGLLWMRAVLAPDTTFLTLVPSFIIAGIGMALFFIPVANVVMGSVPPEYEGVASGTNNAVREAGGVFGIAVLASVFAAAGGYTNAVDFTHGLRTALIVGAAVTAAGALGSLLVPRRRPATEPVDAHAPESALRLGLEPANS